MFTGKRKGGNGERMEHQKWIVDKKWSNWKGGDKIKQM